MRSNVQFCFVPCIDSIKTIDTTGDGDCFCGIALSKLLDINLDFDLLTAEKCQEILEYTNVVANLSTTKYGAIPSMPTKEEILEIL